MARVLIGDNGCNTSRGWDQEATRVRCEVTTLVDDE